MEKVIDLLKAIVSSISREHGHSLLLSANTSAFSTQICPPLELTGKRWVVELLNLETYNSISNITEKITYLLIQLTRGQHGRQPWLSEVTKSAK